MKNFPVTIKEDLFVDGENMNGKTFWISRSVCVAIFLFIQIDNRWYVAANRRGEGCPDYIGYWNCPCGYVDYGETILEAAKRELFEECGLDKNLIISWMSPTINDKEDNITFRYAASVSNPDGLPTLVSTYSEDREISELKWIPIDEIGNYQWAFNHRELIIENFKKI